MGLLPYPAHPQAAPEHFGVPSSGEPRPHDSYM
jgi:hypothetical protein